MQTSVWLRSNTAKETKGRLECQASQNPRERESEIKRTVGALQTHQKGRKSNALGDEVIEGCVSISD